MTPSEEQARIDAAVDDIEAALDAAYASLLAAINAGQDPRAAVAAVMDGFTGATEGAMRAAFADILAGAAGTPSDVPIIVGPVSLSARLYAEAQAAAEVVRGIVQRQVAGVQDARRLALELFEGYGFRDPAAEPLKLSPTNPKLPLYMRDALLADDSVLGDMVRGFAKLQASNLSTPALRAAYSELLAAIESLDGGPKGQKLLKRKLDVAFYERMRYFATRIARTELHKAYAEREVLIMRDDPDIEYVQVRRSPGQNLPCICDLFAGRDLYGLGAGVYPKEQAPVPGYHPFCLTGDAQISHAGRILAVYRRWFDGDLVIITTASGKRLSATINHPVLTRRGWVGAGLLDVGDEVIARADGVGVRGHSFGDDEHEHMPASIAEITDAFCRASGVSSREVPVSAEDFHGDGEGSQVAVVGANGELWNRVDATASEVGSDEQLKIADAGPAGLLGEGVLDLGGETLVGAANCSVCGGSIGEPLLGGERGHADGVLLAGASLGDSVALKPSVDDVAADAELARKIQDGSTGPVFADKVLIVERVPYAGHVFNLETSGGHYTSNGIITHNCRCVLAPRLDLTGRTAKERDDEGDAYFLSRLGEGTAGRIMGSRAKAEEVLQRSRTAEEVANASRDPNYRIRRAEEIT